MDRQEFWRSRYKELRPEWDSSRVIYDRLIAAKLTPSSRALDLGCGQKGAPEAFRKIRSTFGVDPDFEAVRENEMIRNKVASTASPLPFRDATFDLVALSWVLEHLDHPQRALREIHRILKPGGSVVFLTPNTLNYNVWAIRLVPNALHGSLGRRLYGRDEHHSYPTRYRANSPTRIQTTLTSIGFERERLILNGDPSYLSFSGALFRAACWVERLLDRPSLRRARVHIIGSYRRGE